MEKDTKHAFEIQRLTEERDQARRFLIDANNTISERDSIILEYSQLEKDYLNEISDYKERINKTIESISNIEIKSDYKKNIMLAVIDILNQLK